MTPVEEEELFQEIQQRVGPELIVHYITSGGAPDLNVMATIGAKIQEICKEKGVESGWFLKYGLRRAASNGNLINNLSQAWGRPRGTPNLAKAKEEEEAKLKPYKCAYCNKRWVTSTERNSCFRGHKEVH